MIIIIINISIKNSPGIAAIAINHVVGLFSRVSASSIKAPANTNESIKYAPNASMTVSYFGSQPKQ